MNETRYKVFKGTYSQYIQLHAWVNHHKGKASECTECGTTTAKRYEWSNISGEYKQDVSDYRSLCTSCHRRLDYQNKCRNGHELTTDNTYTAPKTGIRACKICRLSYQRQWIKRKEKS